MNLHERIRAAEAELLTSSTRANAARVGDLLHPEFTEIGRSGRRWTRSEIIAALGREDRRPVPDTDEWEFFPVAPDLVLATYRVLAAAPAESAAADGAVSRHSSLWDVSLGRLRLRFHQGTLLRKLV